VYLVVKLGAAEPIMELGAAKLAVEPERKSSSELEIESPERGLAHPVEVQIWRVGVGAGSPESSADVDTEWIHESRDDASEDRVARFGVRAVPGASLELFNLFEQISSSPTV